MNIDRPEHPLTSVVRATLELNPFSLSKLVKLPSIEFRPVKFDLIVPAIFDYEAKTPFDDKTAQTNTRSA